MRICNYFVNMFLLIQMMYKIFFLKMCNFTFIYFAFLFVCLSFCLYPINIKTAERIGSLDLGLGKVPLTERRFSKSVRLRGKKRYFSKNQRNVFEKQFTAKNENGTIFFKSGEFRNFVSNKLAFNAF